MFGRRSNGSIPRSARFIIGAVASLVGAAVLWQAFAISAGKVEGADDSPVTYLFAITMLGLGLTVFVGALAGVGDRAERPASMGLPMRLLLDGFGYVFGFGFAGFAGAMAFTAWRTGAAPAMIGGVVFGFFALLIGGFTLFALVNAISRALRGLPYKDGPRPEARD